MADRRLKVNIRDLENTLERIVKLPLKRYDSKDNSGPKIGVDSQIVYELFPEKVIIPSETDDGRGDALPDGVQPWTDSENYTYEILKALQELKFDIERIKERLSDLEGS
tara:strand:- start:1524 stop:1850 length:327 start_codon:yes stop_codon:yes gene_type:complete